MLENGYIRMYRSLTQWEWYTDANTVRVFIHLLLTVNYEEGRWKGIVVKRGQRIASYSILAKELKMTEKMIRTAVNHLKRTGEVAHTKCAKYAVFTVINYDKFQDQSVIEADCGQAAGSQGAGKGQQRNKAKEYNKAINNNPPYSPPLEGTENVGSGENLDFQTESGSPFESGSHSKTRKPRNILTKAQQETFGMFYTAYPKKQGKGQAERAWKSIDPDKDLLAHILDGLENAKRYDSRFQNRQYTPNPATWLNSKGWEDEHTDQSTNTGYSYTASDKECPHGSFDTDDFFEAALQQTYGGRK